MTTLNTTIRSVPKIYRNKRIYQGKVAATTILGSGDLPPGGNYVEGDGIDITGSVVSLDLSGSAGNGIDITGISIALDTNFIKVTENQGVELKYNNTTKFKTTNTGIAVDVINELTSATGVTIDGVLLKDNKMNWSYVNGRPSTLAGYGISDTKAHFNTALSNGNFGFASGTNHQVAFMSGTTALQYSANFTFDDTTNYLYINGRVGIRHAAPKTKLHIWSGVTTGDGTSTEVLRLQDAWGSAGDGPLMRFTNYHASGTTPNAGEYNLAGIAGRDFAGNWAGGLVFMTPNPGDTGGSALVDRMVIREDGNVVHPDFTTGFQGTHWQIAEDGDAEFRDVLISGGLQVYELIINRLHYQCGGLIIGAGGGKVKTVHVATQGSEQLEFEDPEGDSMLPFTVGAIVMLQDFDLNRTAVIKKIIRQVASINGQVLTLTTTTGWVIGDDTGIYAYGDEVVAIGHVSNSALDSNIYMSAVDSDNPFMRVYDGVNSYSKWSLGDKTAIKLQLGNLESLAGYDIVPVDPGYGLYSDNVYLKGKIVASSGEIGGWVITSDMISKSITANRFLKINAANASYGTGFSLYRANSDISARDVKIIQMGQLYTQGNSLILSGDYGFQIKRLETTGPTYSDLVYFGAYAAYIAGWKIDSDAIYTGTKKSTDGYSAVGITLDSDGSIHAPNFYLNSDGAIAARNIILETDPDGDGYGIKIEGSDIYESKLNTANSITNINRIGYNGGTTQFRQTRIGNGKGATLLAVLGATGPSGGYVSIRRPYITGPFQFWDSTCASTITLDQNDNLKVCTNSNAITIYLPTSYLVNGMCFIIKKAGSGAVTVDHNGGSQIRNLNGNDVDSISLGTQASYWFVYNNSLYKWVLLNN